MPKRAYRSLVIIFVLVAAVCARLGVWQLDRLGERRAANAAARERRSLPVVTLGGGSGLADSLLADRRVTVSGRYDHEREIVLRGQVHDGVPGVHLVTPLLLNGTDTAVLVNRGFVPAPDAATVTNADSLREPGTVRVEGIALPIGAAHEGKPITQQGRTTWARLDRDALREALPYPISGFYVRRLADGPGHAYLPRALPAPALDDGPHLSYALQWFSFTGLAIVFAGIIWWKRP